MKSLIEDLDVVKVSKKLSELDVSINLDGIVIDILWFRSMSVTNSWIINNHKHSSYEFHFVYKGKSKVILEDSEFIVNEGEFYVTAPGIYHEQKNVDEQEYIELSINCDFKDVNNIYYTNNDKNNEAINIIHILKNANCRPMIDKYNVIDKFKEALYEANSKELGYFNRIKQIIGFIIIDTARTILNNQIWLQEYTHKDYTHIKFSKNDHRFKEIERFIKDNVATNPSILELSNHMHLSEKQICRIIKEKVGCSTKQYISLVRHGMAKEYLLKTEYSIDEIASLLGFSSQYYFNQFFKRVEGEPPGAFRNNYNKV